MKEKEWSSRWRGGREEEGAEGAAKIGFVEIFILLRDVGVGGLGLMKEEQMHGFHSASVSTPNLLMHVWRGGLGRPWICVFFPSDLRGIHIMVISRIGEEMGKCIAKD